MDENKVKVLVGLFGFFLSEVDDFYVSYSKLDDLESICKLVRKRYGNMAFGFRRLRPVGHQPFGRDDEYLDPGWIYICGGKVESAKEVLSRDDPKEEVLRSNIRCNKIAAILKTPVGKTFQFDPKKDIVLDVKE